MFLIKRIARFVLFSLTSNRYLSAVLKWPFIAFHFYKNRQIGKKRIKKTPWVFAASSFDAATRVRYAKKVFSEYFQHAKLSESGIVGKTILEMGPGESLAVALQFIAHGADKVVCFDRFESLLPGSFQNLIYTELIEGLPQKQRERCLAAISFSEGDISLNPAKLCYRTGAGIQEIENNFRGTFDYIISRAVLEHIYDMDNTLNSMIRLLAPGGRMLHEVDFRDHGMFSLYGFNKFTFLTISEKLWKKITSHSGAPNRKLYRYFDTKLKITQFPYNILKFVSDREENKTIGNALSPGADYSFDRIDEIRKIRPRLQPDFLEMPDEELLLDGVFFTLFKTPLHSSQNLS